MSNDNELAVWSWRPKTRTLENFGDELGPQFVSMLGYRTRRTPIADADLVTAGSVMQTAILEGKDGLTVWGAGLIRPETELPSRELNIAAARGRLTSRALDLPADMTLGDPGILASVFWKRPPVRYRVGVVPHYTDTRSYPWADVVIDVTRPVEEVVASIASCATIVSSSLHGVIIAQSYQVPAMRMHHPKVVGGDFKWADFQTALDRDVAVVQSDLIEALQKGLDHPHLITTAATQGPAEQPSKPAAKPRGRPRLRRP